MARLVICDDHDAVDKPVCDQTTKRSAQCSWIFYRYSGGEIPREKREGGEAHSLLVSPRSAISRLKTKAARHTRLLDSNISTVLHKGRNFYQFLCALPISSPTETILSNTTPLRRVARRSLAKRTRSGKAAFSLSRNLDRFD